MKKTIFDLQQMKAAGRPITMITAYDYPTAKLVEQAGVDTILVGDSLGMVVLGYESTVPVTMADMLHHTKPVRRGAPQTFVIADLPYLSYATPDLALENAGRLIQEGGADAVKLEGGQNYAERVQILTEAGVPVVGHIGLTPQTAAQLGGFKVQGRDLAGSLRLLDDARSLQEAGAILIVLEAIPSPLAALITASLSVPTIGIGAGSSCDGQVLVLHDLLGLFRRFVPKFVKQYASLNTEIITAVQTYCHDVQNRTFPTENHSFGMDPSVLEAILKHQPEFIT